MAAPIIDLTTVLSGAELPDRSKKIHHACLSTGFFLIVGLD